LPLAGHEGHALVPAVEGDVEDAAELVELQFDRDDLV
jgi:hypothetical protein